MNETSGSERRRFHRILMDQDAVLSVEGETHNAVVVDISLKGLLVRVRDAWRPAPAQVVNAEVRLDDSEDCCIRFSGEVSHLEDDLVGLHSLSIDLDSATRLRRLVELNLDDHALLERELAHMIES